MKANASLLLLALFTTAAGACGNRLLVGNDPDGGAPPLTPTGAAGTSPPATGAAGTSPPATSDASAAGIGGALDAPQGTGIGGSGPPTTTRIVTPLQIPGELALRRIAKLLWNAEPSEDLLSQARLGRFTTTDDLYGPARQMLADPRARTGLGAFYRWWLLLPRLEKLTKDPQLFPTFTPALKADMAAETETFGVEVTLMPGGTFLTLMTAPFSFINQRLAEVYGVAGVTGDALRQVSLDPKQRAGLLTQPALQALTSFEKRNSPSARGSYMLTRFQCMQIPPPPPNISGLDPLPPNMTVRQALAQSLNQAACAACHGLLDPPGLPFETFDAIGRWRTTDNGFPVDVSGITIQNLADGPTMVDGPIALANAMAISPRVQECMARQWLGFFTGRDDLTTLDERVVQSVTGTFRASGLDLKELIAAVLTSESFLAP